MTSGLEVARWLLKVKLDDLICTEPHAASACILCSTGITEVLCQVVHLVN